MPSGDLPPEAELEMNRRYFLRRVAGTASWFVMTGRGYAFGKRSKGIPKFEATLPGLGPDGTNNWGNYITVLSPDTKTYPGIDYYEIVAQQFTQT